MILIKLTTELDKLNKTSDGELIVKNHKALWNFYIVRGQLLYITGGLHPVRRWTRVLKQHRPNWHWSVDYSQLSDNRLWECQLLDRGLNQKHLSLIQAKLVIRTVIQECLFEFSHDNDFKSDWKANQNVISTLCRVIALSTNEIQTVVTATTQMQLQWQAAGLSEINPSFAPILQQKPDPEELPMLDKYLNGKLTLWDIALQAKKPVIEVTSSLMPLVEKGMLQFQEIPDLPLPKPVLQPVSKNRFLLEKQLPQSHSKQPLIACIDDSPVLSLALKKILMPAGYQMLSIPEPMRGFSQLLERNPDLILLDLLLPNADGYSVCKFLRESSLFKKTPIIILTAKNSQIDRTRAQLVGATEFLIKPPQPQELLQMVRKHIRR